MRPVFLLFALLLGLSAARAQSLEEIDRRQAALIEAWEKTPLTIRRALFINRTPRFRPLPGARVEDVQTR